MARKTACLCAILCLLAARCGNAEVLLNKAFASDALLSGIKKDAFHSHLQRMLQMDEEPRGSEICSPAAFERNGKGCTAIEPGPQETIKATDAKPVQVVASSCEGPDCLVAPMPGETGAPERENVTAAPQSPQLKAVAFGPMTQEAFQRMAQRKRAALRAKLEEAGELTEELDAFLRSEHITDDTGIPLPATRSAAATTTTTAAAAETTPLPTPSTHAAEHITDDAGIPLPATTSATKASEATSSKAKPNADFEMRFEPQTPAPASTSAASCTSENGTTTDSCASKPGADFEMRFEPQTPSPDPHLVAPVAVAESPALAPTVTRRVSSIGQDTAAEKPAEKAAEKVAEQQTASGPARPPMTEQEAARVAAQQAAQQAALARKRELARSEPGRPQPTQTQTQSRSQAASDGSAQRLRPQASSAQAQQSGSATAKPAPTREAAMSAAAQAVRQQQQQAQRTRQTEVERVLMAGAGADGPVRSSDRTARSGGSTTSSVKKSAAKRASSSSSASPSQWGVLDYLCALTLVVAVSAALFVTAAVVEDQMSPRRAWRTQGTPLPVHWLSLSRSLWRRCRRAFIASRKHLIGHSSDLPLSSHEGHGALARAVSSAATFLHVFWSHLTDIRNRYCRTPSGSTGGAVDDAAHHMPYTRSQMASPFAAVQGLGPQQAYVIQAPDSSAVTAQAELLRRRH